MKPRNIIPVPKGLVKIYKVGEQEPICPASQPAEDTRETIRVTRGVNGGDSPPRKQIVHFAYAGACDAGFLEGIQQRGGGWRYGKIASVCRAFGPAWRADERPRNHSRYVVRRYQKR